MSYVDYFLIFDDITGDSTDAQFPGAIEVKKWSWGGANRGILYRESRNDSGPGRNNGRVEMQDLRFEKLSSIASPVLMQYCASGQPLASAQLILRRGSGDSNSTYMTILFNEVLITEYNVDGTSDNVLTVDKVSLNYTAVTYRFRPQRNDDGFGAWVETSYSLKDNM